MKSVLLMVLACLSARAAIVIEDVTVIDVLAGAARPHCNVVIQGDRILSVGTGQPLGPVPQQARIVDGRGKFLIPGLWDMHVHLWSKESQLARFLSMGVTGVEDMGSDFTRVSAWRDEIEAGKFAGPHIVTSGPAVGDQADDDPKLPVLVASNPRDARGAFDRLYDMNVDFISVQPTLSRDSYVALAEQARHWHLRMVGAVPTAVNAWDALDAHQSSIEGLNGILKAVSTDAEAVRFFEACATRGVRVAPLLAESQHADQFKDYYRLLTLATQTKVEMLAGAGEDSTLQDELEQMVAAGLSTEEALRAATIAPARFLESTALMGTVEKGKLADLVLLNANPLVDIKNVRKIAGVFARGKYFSRATMNAWVPKN
jgi:Amidohydrolase family